MECGGSSNNFQRLSKSASGISNGITPEHEHVVHEQNCSIPAANVLKVMRKILPSHAKISDEAKETIQECVSEFISFVTSEANERCLHEKRKTIIAEDVLWAMGTLGFDEYIEPLTMYLNRYRELEGKRGFVQVESVKQRPVEIAPAPAPSYPHEFPMVDPHQGLFVPQGMAEYFKDGSYMNTNGSFDVHPPFN